MLAIAVILVSVIVYGIVCAGFWKALILTVLTIGLMFFTANRLQRPLVLCFLPGALVGMLFVLKVKQVNAQVKTISAALAICLVFLTRQNYSHHLAVIVNFVIIIFEIGVFLTAVLSWIEGEESVITTESLTGAQCDTFTFDFDGLTIGQVASASSAAAGAGAVQTWVQTVVEFARVTIDEAMSGLQCRVFPAMISQVFYQQRVKDEFLTLLGCNETETSGTTAERWSGWLRDMAVKLKFMNSETGESRMSNRVIDAVVLYHIL